MATPEQPTCRCHGQPMRRRGSGAGWRCAVKQRAYDRAYNARSTKKEERYRRLKAAGLCVHCGQDVAITETRCFACAGILDESNLNRVV